MRWEWEVTCWLAITDTTMIGWTRDLPQLWEVRVVNDVFPNMALSLPEIC